MGDHLTMRARFSDEASPPYLHLGNRVVQGVSNPEAFTHLANATQIDLMPPHGGFGVGWIEIRRARFPSAGLTGWIVERRPHSDPRMGGNITQLYAQ
jgi:hypothetical protein